VNLLADWDEAEAVSTSATRALSGRIRLAAPLSFGVTYLGPALTDFLKVNPDIDFDIDFSDRQVDLISEGIDLAIRIGQLTDSGLIARKIAPVRMIAAASPSYLETHSVPKNADELKNHQELRYTNRSRKGWDYIAPDGSKGSLEMQARLQANNGDFLTNAAISGEGIVIQPTFIMCDAIRSGELDVILPDYIWPDISAYAVYPPTRHLSLRVRTFVDFLVDRFSGTPPWDVDIP